MKEDPRTPEDLIQDEYFKSMLEGRMQKTLDEWRVKTGAVKIYVCFDGRDNWRKSFYERYKATRNNATYVKTLFEKAVPWVEKWVSQNNDSVASFFNDRFEADDWIHLAVRALFRKESPPTEVTILASDHDFIPLLAYPGVRIVNLNEKEVCLPADYNTPEEYLAAKVLIGDRSDNIPSVIPRCGVKTALKILRGNKLEERLVDSEKYREAWERNRRLIDNSLLEKDAETFKIFEDSFKKLLY
jgi:5'-3' exonuclease